ncbi:uncharacterized protein PV09_00322 [Verruconis gallopava]|uniref:Secreted protein n=1 Tax=Verruconis gallopava TaxID=253628 RepID=A0A0D1Z8X2_9PEZI|nr:uncharacterized protein PV09_00322 [Verruconis gallopava]KIW09437.1 hypothetical protein PV09_00322 [Verruconis gallopava]
MPSEFHTMPTSHVHFLASLVVLLDRFSCLVKEGSCAGRIASPQQIAAGFGSLSPSCSDKLPLAWLLPTVDRDLLVQHCSNGWAMAFRPLQDVVTNGSSRVELPLYASSSEDEDDRRTFGTEIGCTSLMNNCTHSDRRGKQSRPKSSELVCM